MHFPGKRLTVTCRSLGIECAAAIIGEGSKKFGPKLEGVVIRTGDREKLEAGILRRDASRPSDEQKEVRKARKQQSDTEACIEEMRLQFPAMPEADVATCAAHATEIGSGRVGRSSLAGNTTRKAVVAFIRHKYTPYDSLLEAGCERDDARAQVLALVQLKVNEWTPNQAFSVKPGRPTKRKRRQSS
jgi:hypothetical protein